MVDLYRGDCLEVMGFMPDNSVDCIIADPPYFRVKNEPWDRQWNSREGFLTWLEQVATEWRRVLKPNGSLYCFASPQMAAHVEVMLGRLFEVLTRITWDKEATVTGGMHRRHKKEGLRSFVAASENIIFCEHHGADNIAKGEAGYQAKCDELRGFVFEPLRAYLDGEKMRAGFTNPEVNKALGTQMASHYFTASQWALPTERWYNALRDLFNGNGGEGLRREYEDLRREYEDLRREYEDLRREYEDLRRPFSVTADVPYTDVWAFEPVRAYKGKHPCEKPADMLAHMITASTKPRAVVLDSFMGNGSTGEQCVKLGRRFIGIEQSKHHFQIAQERISAA